MKIFTFILGICLFIVNAHAQAPGYIGKKTPINLEINSFPAIRFSELEEGKLPVNFRAALKTERVFSRRFSLVASASHVLVKTDYEFDEFNRATIGQARLSGFALGIGAKMYNFKRVGNIAPIGPFQEIEAFYLFYNLNDVDKQFYQDGRERLGQYQDLGLSIGMGTQRVFKQNFTYTFGAKVGTALGLFRAPEETEAERYLHEIAIDRLQGYFFLNVYAGIGLLLF